MLQAILNKLARNNRSVYLDLSEYEFLAEHYCHWIERHEGNAYVNGKLILITSYT